MSAKMTKTLSIMVFPNYQDESSVVRSRERCTGETSRHRRCLDECFVWRELLVLSFNPFSFLSAAFFLYLLKKGHYCCLVGLKPLRNPESKPQPKTLSSIWWIWGETYIKFYQMTYCHRIWCNQNVLSMSSQCYLIALVSWANHLWYPGKHV